MGDIILTTPLLQALDAAFPQAEIDYLAEKPYHQVLHHHPHISSVLSFERKRSFAIIRTLMKTRYDLAIDLFGNPRSALLTAFSGARMRIGGDFRIRRHVYTHAIKTEQGLNAIQFHLSYLNPLQIKAPQGSPVVAVSANEQQWARTCLKEMGLNLQEPVIGMHPGASWPAKRWYWQRFARLADRLTQAHGIQVLVTMGAAEKERVESVLNRCQQRIYSPGLLSIRRLAAIQSLLDVYISNDCGPLHLAAAVGTKTVGIFGPGEPDIWYPYDKAKGHRLVYNEIDCSHCHQNFCTRMDCMKSITVKQVEKATLESLATIQP